MERGRAILQTRTDVKKVQICVVVKLVKGWEIYITSMRFVHHLLHGGDEIVRVVECRIRKGTHIEADNTVQISEGLDDNLPHVEVGVLEKLLHGNLFVVLRLDLELWSEGITSPETSPACSAEHHNTDQTEGNLRQCSSSKLLIAAGPPTSFGFYMAASPNALQPSRAGFFQGVQVKSNNFKSPCWSA